VSDRTGPFQEAVRTLAEQAQEYIDALKTDPPDFVIHDLALVLYGTAGDVLMFSPVTRDEEEFANRPITEDEMEEFSSLVQAYDSRIKNIASQEEIRVIEKLIKHATGALGENDRKNSLIRDCIEALGDIYKTLGYMD
jgi:hypothetical protein